MKIKNFMKYFKEGVLKYFKIFLKFLNIFQSEIFYRASLVTALCAYVSRNYNCSERSDCPCGRCGDQLCDECDTPPCRCNCAPAVRPRGRSRR